jgi:hypothetical protein
MRYTALNYRTTSLIQVMAESDEKVRFFLIAALCGALGVASGYAIFLISDDIEKHPWQFLGALLGAAFVSYVIEWLRDLIRHGEIEVETHPVMRSIGTFVVVLMFELFISGFHAGFEMGPALVLKTGASLLGPDAPVVGVPWTVVLVSGAWMVAGALLAGWLSLHILHGEDAITMRNILLSSRWGTIGGLVIAPAVIGVYILVGRGLVALQYFIRYAPAASGKYADMGTMSRFANHNGLMLILELPIAVLRAAAMHGLPMFWLCYAGLFVVLILLTSIPKNWKYRDDMAPLINMTLLGVLFCIFNPIVRTIWVVLKEFADMKLLWALIDAVLLGAVVWGVPGLLLGALVPLLKRAGRSPQSWAMIGYGAAALLVLASMITQHAWPLIPAGVALISGLLFQRGMPVKEFWPFAALCVAIGISGAMSVSQSFTFRGVLMQLHTIDAIRPPSPGESPEVVAPIVDWNPTEDEIKTALREKAKNDAEEAEAQKKADEAARVLEVSIAGSVGFWITVGLLACWSMYERDHTAGEEA